MRYILETGSELSPEHIARINAAAHPYILTMQRPKLEIVGRRWFQKTYGNTYHTARVFINGKLVHKSERQYGYGSQYVTTAIEWLKDAGHLPADFDGFTAGLRDLFDFQHHAEDVARQRDL